MLAVKPTVAIVNTDSFPQAIETIGGLNGLNAPNRKVVVKVGIYNPKTGICSTIKTLNAIITAFDQASEILIVESDSGAGSGLKRLEVWNDCYNNRATPFNLSTDEYTQLVDIAGEQIPFAKTLLDPKTFISTHVPRRYEEAGLEDLMNQGFVIKNLLGLVLDTKKHRFHDKLATALIDMYETAGGIDLAVLDATHVFLGWKKKRITVSPDRLIVGKDAFAVEAVGMHLLGFDPTEMSVLQEAQARGLGEINIDQINIVGDIEGPKQLISQAFTKLVPKLV
ncbi:DUF362 domain-containing protein [Candidatus Bathyarchaeota archaeon]|nr:DUF362 domain-containing protein [Candidatus Bathyarchaeota archaeon]